MNLLDMNIDELTALMSELAQPPYRAGQLFKWLHEGEHIGGMTNLPKALRERLEGYEVGGCEIALALESKLDGTRKYLFRFTDGALCEGVLMRYSYGNTLCISTQIGCAMGCAFCQSTRGGLERDLLPGEMLSQVLAINREQLTRQVRTDGGRGVTNVVLMGSGEPLLNCDNVFKFIRLLSAPQGINISVRNISLSTCGIVPGMYALIESGLTPTLAVSLHAPNDELRAQIMPVTKKYPIGEVLPAAQEYAKRTGRRVIIEYALIKGVNDGSGHAAELANILRAINCHVNLIPLNPISDGALEGSGRKDAEAFAKTLASGGISATVRREMGADIQGACGQLRGSEMEKLNQQKND